MSLALRILQVDVPEAAFDRVVAFWAGALSATPVDAPGAFVHLVDATSAVEVHVQAIRSRVPRYHLDLEADDRDVEVARLIAAGAYELDRFDAGYTVLSDPAGLSLCVIDADAAVPTPVAEALPDRGYLAAIVVEVAAPVASAEGRFWSTTLTAEAGADARGMWQLDGVQGPGGAVRFAVRPAGPAAAPRLHVELLAPDVAAEAARLEQLGATRVTEGTATIRLADPVDNQLLVRAGAVAGIAADRVG